LRAKFSAVGVAKMLVIAAALLPLLLLALISWFDWIESRDEVRRSAREGATFYARDARQVFEIAELVAVRVGNRLQLMSWGEIGTSPAISDYLASLAQDYSQIDAIRLADANGVVRAASQKLPSRTASVAHRDYFQALRAEDAGTVIGAVVQAQLMSGTNFNIVRRRLTTKGEFDGIVIVTVFTRSLTSHWQAMHPLEQSVIRLWRGDGTLLATLPEASGHDQLAQAISPLVKAARSAGQAELAGDSDYDGSARTYSGNKLGNHDIYIEHGIAHDAIHANWLKKFRVRVLYFALVIAALLLLSVLTLRLSRRQQAHTGHLEALSLKLSEEIELRTRTENQLLASERRLAAASQARYAAVVESSGDAIVTLDENDRVQTWNKAAAGLYGHPAEAIIGQPYLSLVAPEQSVATRGALAEAHAGKVMAGSESVHITRSGTLVDVSVTLSPVLATDGSVVGLSVIARSIGEAKAAQMRILNLNRMYATLSRCNEAIVHCLSEDELYQRICNIAIDPGGMKMAWIGVVGKDGYVTAAASAGEGTGHLQGLRISTADETLGRGPTGTSVRENRPMWCQDFRNDPATAPWHERAAQFGWGASAALPLRRDGRVVAVLALYSATPHAFDDDTRNLLIEMAADISFAQENLARARRAARDADQLALAEARWRFALDSGGHGIWEWNTQTDRVFFSHGWKRMLGYEDGDIGDSLDEWKSRVHPEDLTVTLALIERHFAGVAPFYLSEFRMRCKDGGYSWILDRGRVVQRDEAGKPLLVIGTHTDITDRKLAEEALRQSEWQFRTMFEQAPLGIARIDSLDGRILDANPVFAAITGRPPEALSRIDWMQITHPDDVQGDLDNMAKMNAGRTAGYSMKKRYMRPDGSQVRVNMTIASLRVGEGERACHLAMIEDITDSERAIEALHEREAQFRAIAEQTMVGVYMHDGQTLTYANERMAEIFGYASAEITGLPLERLVAPEDIPLVHGKIDERLSGRARHAKYEFHGLRKDGSQVLVGLQSSITQVQGRLIIIGLLQDITEKRHIEDQAREYLRQLESAFMRTVEVAMNLSELRDPYTAGHEKRVAEIAVAIGREMGLDEARLEGLRVAGYLHDIGKITIPAEILASPRRLNKTEYELVMEHPRAGHNVLKDVNFPWPVAQVALQHHERMDGSGYPQGLRGEEIMLESRIVAVADVVEAMGSHRPYRPGLGIDAALAEVQAKRGTGFDPQVVDACLRLFRDKHFPLPA